MKRIILMVLLLVGIFQFLTGVEIAPRISDREIVERLAKLEEKQNALEKRIEDLRSEMIARFEAVDKRFEAVDKRFEAVDKRLDILRWMFGIFITVSIVILGFVVRMQWQLQKRQVEIEKSLETHKDEIAFLKSIIEKLITPKGAL